MIAWTPALRALACPTRENPDPDAILRILGGISNVTDAVVYRTVEGSYAQMRDWNHAREIERVKIARERTPAALLPLVDRALEERAREAPPSGKLDVDVEAATVALDLAHTFLAVPYWIAKEGPSFALRALVRVFAFEPSHKRGYGYGRGVWIEENWRLLHARLEWSLLRAVLATVDEATYVEARAAAQTLRDGAPLYVRTALSFVFPGERAWADDDANETLATQKSAFHHETLLATVASLDLAERLLRLDDVLLDDNICMTLLAAHGEDGARLLLAALDKAPRADVRKRYASAAALVSSKPAAEGLARWLGDKSVAPIVTKYMLANADLAREVLGEMARPRSKHKLAGAAALLLERLSKGGQGQRAPRAKPSSRRRDSAPVLSLTPLAYPTRIVWKEGQEEQNARANAEWDAERQSAWKDTHATDEMLVAWMGQRSLPLFWVGRIADAGIASATLRQRPKSSWWGSGLEVGAHDILARHGMRVVPTLLDYATSVSKLAPVVALIDGPEVAPLMANWRARSKSARAVAETWLLAYAEAAAIGLLPVALGTAGTARESAIAALAYLREQGHTKTIESVAARYGADATAAVARLFEGSQAMPVLPARTKKLPEFANADDLPRPKTLGGEAMGVEATRKLVSLLAECDGVSTHPELSEAKRAFTPESLREFAWALFERWLAANAPPKEIWALLALGAVGDDEVVKRLAPLIRAWPKEKAIARASTGLDVLSTIGTDLALASIDALSRGTRFASVRDKSNKMILAVARERGLTAEELADRIVPDLEGMRIEGPLDKEGKHVVAFQVERLERAMITERTWKKDDFLTFVAGHPLMRQLARGLVWSASDDTTRRLFRVAEDGTLADAHDASLTLANADAVRIVHPLDLSDTEKSAWTAVFADYEVIQPFEQLARATFAPAQRAEFTNGLTLSAGGVRQLLTRGFEPSGDSWIHELVRSEGTLVIVIGLQPGFAVDRRDIDAQTVDSLKVLDGELADLSPIAYSELRRTIGSLR